MATIDDFLTAVNGGDAEAVRVMLGADPSLASGRGRGGESPVLAAAYRGRDDLLQLLLPHARLDVFEAAAVGDVARVRALVESDPGLLNRHNGSDGWTALHLAAFFGRREVAEELLARGADVSAASRNPTANHPLHAALAGRTDRQLVERLLARGADVNGRAGAGVTPLHLAASRGSADLVEMLYRQGANPAARMGDGTTVEAIARQRGHAAVADQVRGYLDATG